MGLYVCGEGIRIVKEKYRSVVMVCGVIFALTTGSIKMLKLSVNSYNFLETVRHAQLLDYSISLGTGYSSTGLFGGTQDTAPLVYDQVDCIGTESTLSSCTLSDYGTLNPTCTAVAGLKCAG